MRQLHDIERPLVAYLLKQAALDIDLNGVRVEPMDDGGMGGLIFLSDNEKRSKSQSVAECWFTDGGGVEAWVTLNIDQYGELFELDVWKVDFSPLGRWPNTDDIHERNVPNTSIH